MCLPPFPDGKCCRNPKNPNVSGSTDAANRVLICCCGCKQLIRRRARCRLTGRDSRGAADCWEGVTPLSLSLCSLLFLLHFHPLISHQRLPGRRGAIIMSHLHRHVSLFRPFTCGSEPHFNSPCCTTALPSLHSFIPSSYLYHPLARRAASSHVPDLLINNRAAPAQRILLLSMFSTLKLMSDRACIFTGLHHSGDVTPSCTPLSSPPTTALRCVCGSIPRSLFPPTSAVTKQLRGHSISLSWPESREYDPP